MWDALFAVMVLCVQKGRALDGTPRNRLAILFWPLHPGPSIASKSLNVDEIRRALLSYSESVKGILL